MFCFLTGTLELSFNRVLREGGMVSQLWEEGMSVIPRAFSSGMGTEMSPEVEEPSWRWRIQRAEVAGAQCRHRNWDGFL